MALSCKNSNIVFDAFRKVFDEYNATTTDRKSDGGYESICTIQQAVSRSQIKELLELTKDVHNSMGIYADGVTGLVKVIFF
jgi:hypothetical protein